MGPFWLASLILFSGTLAAPAWSDTAGKPCAILLHGLGRSGASMDKMAGALEDKGYLIWNPTYPSTREPIEALSAVVERGLRFCESRGSRDIFMVTHSLGGILVRFHFQDREPGALRAVVMLAPPNQGSEVVDHYRDAWWFRTALGPAAQQLGTGPGSLPRSLKPVTFPVGILAGTESSDPWFSGLFRGPHDGKVSVESTKLPEMKDFRTVPAGHTFIMASDEVIRQTVFFFENLRFR